MSPPLSCDFFSYRISLFGLFGANPLLKRRQTSQDHRAVLTNLSPPTGTRGGWLPLFTELLRIFEGTSGFPGGNPCLSAYEKETTPPHKAALSLSFSS